MRVLPKTYSISKAFTCRTTRSERVLEIAEAFGIGLATKSFKVFEDLKIEIHPGDVIYVNGQSGSGKSVLLRELTAALKADGLVVADIDSVVLEDRPLIDQIGRNTNEAVEILSRAGLNDAYLCVRKPSELSDGQRYRFRLAKLMESDANVWVADEWGAILDRVTAKAVSFNAQKLARARGVVLIVATTHTDLEDELGASLTIRKRFMTRVDVERVDAPV